MQASDKVYCLKTQLNAVSRIWLTTVQWRQQLDSQNQLSQNAVCYIFSLYRNFTPKSSQFIWVFDTL
jgi:hypothetical protein